MQTNNLASNNLLSSDEDVFRQAVDKNPLGMPQLRRSLTISMY